jgi:hypothetical protein
MNRGRLPGIASATKRLAYGARRRYYYAWRGGPLLKTEDGRPLQPNDPQFVIAYAAAHEARRKPATGTLFSLIAAYKASIEFTGRAEKTKKDYRRYLKMIEDELGNNATRGRAGPTRPWKIQGVARLHVRSTARGRLRVDGARAGARSGKGPRRHYGQRM